MIYPSMDEEGTFYILESSPVVTGEELTDAQPTFDVAERTPGAREARDWVLRPLTRQH